MNVIQPSKESISKLKAIWEKLVGGQVSIIFEFGARYCEDTVELQKAFFSNKVYSFECNPTTIPICRSVVAQSNRLFLTETAVGDFDGKVKFYPMNIDKTITTWQDGNQGASSLFVASGKYKVEEYHQDEIEVPMIKASTFMIDNGINEVDILWMDIQGAELMALRGFEDKLRCVKIIHSEVEFLEIYNNQPLFKDIKAFLRRKGFIFWDFTSKGKYAGDAVFVRRDLIKFKFHLGNQLLRLKNVFKWRK